MRFLLVGDPHAVRSELPDVAALINQVERLAVQETVDYVVFLGDLYDAFGLKDVEVERFWDNAFARITKHKIKVIALVGNHDRPGDQASTANSLQLHSRFDRHGDEAVAIVDRPQQFGGVGFLPFYFKAEEFVAAANTLKDEKVVICHQSLKGATYDSGHDVDDGADTSKVPQELVISGHIHTAQSFGKVWYPGSPRWRTAHDANKEKSLWFIRVDSTGMVAESRFFPSECRKLLHLEDVEGVVPKPILQDPHARYVVDIKGSAAYIEDRKKVWNLTNVRIRALPTDKKSSKVKESEGVDVAFKKFVVSFKPTFGTDHETLLKVLQERLHHGVTY